MECGLGTDFKKSATVRLGQVGRFNGAYNTAADDDGWAHLGKVGQYISNNSSFSPVNYGYKKLSDLIRASELFDIDTREKNVVFIRSPEK